MNGDLIFGDTSKHDKDNVPTIVNRCIAPRKARNARAFLVWSVRAHRVIASARKDGLSFAKPSQKYETTLGTILPISDAEEEYINAGARHATIEIPQPDKRKHPQFGYNPDIVFDGSPEQEAMERIVVDNVFDLDEDMVERVKQSSQDTKSKFVESMLDNGASMLMASDEASAEVEAILRDGLGISAKMDNSLSELISNLLRLSLTSVCLDNTHIPKKNKDQFLSHLTKFLAEDTFKAFVKQDTGAKYSQRLENLVAKMRSKDGTSAESEDVSTNFATMRGRSGKKTSVSPDEVKGVRFGGIK